MSISKMQLAYTLLSPAIFVLGIYSGNSSLGFMGIFLNLPFTTGAWVLGTVFASFSGIESAYLFGAFIGIAIQLYLLFLIYNRFGRWFRGRKST